MMTDATYGFLEFRDLRALGERAGNETSDHRQSLAGLQLRDECECAVQFRAIHLTREHEQLRPPILRVLHFVLDVEQGESRG